MFGAVRLSAVVSVDFTDCSYSARMAHASSVSENAIAIIVACSLFLALRSTALCVFLFHWEAVSPLQMDPQDGSAKEKTTIKPVIMTP